MSKNTLTALMVTLAIVSSVGYILLKQSATLPAVTHPIAINSHESSTPVVATDTRVIATTSPVATTTDQVSPTMSRLLKLINDCKVERVDFGDAYGNPPIAVSAIILKDNTSFDKPGDINMNELSTLYKAILAMRYQCRIKIDESRVHHGDQ